MNRKSAIAIIGIIILFLGIFRPKLVDATFSGVTSRGFNGETGLNATSIPITTPDLTANITVGKIAIVQCVADNEQTTDGSSSDITSVTDTDSHTWTKVYETTETDGADNDGSETALFWTKVTTQIDTSDTIRCNFTSTPADAIISVFEATITAGNTVTTVTPASTAAASGTSLSDTQGSLTSREYLLVGSFGAEGEDTAKTPDATGGAAYTELVDQVSATAGAADANVQNHLQYRIATVTTDTVDSTAVTFTSGTQTLVAFYEIEEIITVSGTIKQTNESSNYDCSAVTAVTVHASTNGGANKSADCTSSGGTFTISASKPSGADIPLVVYIDSGESIKGTTVTLTANGTSNISNLDIYVDRLIVTQESSTAIANSHLATADNGNAGIRYSVTSSNLTVDTDIELHVKSSKTYTPGGTVTTQGTGDLHIDDSATVTLANATNTIARDILADGGSTLHINASTNVNGGDITTSGTSATVDTTSGTPTVTMSGTGSIGGGTTPTLEFHILATTGSGTTTISSATTINNNLSVGGTTATLIVGATTTVGVDASVASGTTLQNTASLTVTGDIAVTGKLTVSSTLAVNGGDLTTSGTGVSGVSINYSNTPTVTIASASEAHTLGGGTGTITFYNLTMNGSSQTTTLSTNNMVIDNALSVGTSHTFAMSTNSITIGSTSISDSGDITMASSAASSQSSSGTVTILGNSNAADWSGPGTFTAYNLTIGNSSATMTVDNETNDLPLDVNNTFTNTANATFQASSTSSFTVGHNWSNSTSGVFTSNSGTVTMDGTSGSKTITTGGDSFNNLSIDNGGTAITWELQDALDVNGNLLIDTSNTLDAKSGSNFAVTVAGNWTNNGTYTARSNATSFDGGTDSTQIIDGNTTFHSVFISGGDRIMQFGAGDTFTVENVNSPDVQIEGSACTTPISMRSTLKGTQYTLTVGATAEEVYSFIDFQDANFTNSVDLTSTENSNSGNNTNLTFGNNLCISSSTDSSAIATGYSFQRKTFYDDLDSSYWVFNHDGDEIEVKYSLNGTGWNVPDTAAAGHLAYDTNDFSVWWKDIGGLAYVFLAVASGDDILIRRGTLSDTEIGWDSDVVTAFNGGGASDSYSYPYFTLDSSNYMWVGARYYNGTNYVYKAVRSDVNDTGDATWDTNIGFGTTVTEAQISDDQTNANVFGNIVPLASQDMYATFVVNTAIEGCKWLNSSTSWKDSGGSNSCTPTVGGGDESTFFDTLEDNLIAHWKLDESSWNGTNDEVVDSSGNANHGTRFANATTVSQGFNRAGTFDNNDSVVRIPDDSTSLDLGLETDSYTISAWFKTSASDAVTDCIITKDDNSGVTPFRLCLTSSTKSPSFTVNDGTDKSSATAGAYNDEIWHNVVAGIEYIANDTKKTYLYVDGALVDSDTHTISVSVANNDEIALGNGRNSTYNLSDFDGELDDIRVYNRLLSGEEASKLYQLHPSKTNIDDASDFGALPGSSRQMVRTSTGTIYSFLNDAGNCEMWKSPDGVTWTTVGTAKTCDSGTGIAAAIDSSNTIHVLWSRSFTGEGVMYDTFSSDAFGGLNNVVYTYATGDVFGDLAVAVDSSNIPHALYLINDGNGDSLLYDNRVGGTWGTDVALDTNAGGGTLTMSHPDIAINESNFVELVWRDNTTVTAMSSDRNDPSLIDHFASHEIDTTGTEPSLAIDTLTGKTWVAYRDTSDNTIDLAGTTAAYAGWGTGGNWSIATKTDVGTEPSVAVAGLSEVYVFYENDTDDISYDLYDGSSWNGEVVLQTGTFQDVKAKWVFEWNNFGANRIGYLFSDGTDVFWDYLYVRRSPTNINNASDFGANLDNGRQVFRDSSGDLYTILIDDGTDIEVWKSTDEGFTWTEQDAADGPTVTNGSAVAAAMGSDAIHFIYYFSTDTDLKYNTFTLGTGQFGTASIAVDASVIADYTATIDTNDKLHVTYEQGGVFRYTNNVSGTFKSPVSIATGSVDKADMTIDEDNIPIATYLTNGFNDLVAAVGNQNDATSFGTPYTVDSDINNDSNVRGLSVGVDSGGNTWIAYVNNDVGGSGNDYISLAKRTDGSETSSWSTGWTDTTNSPIHNSKLGSEPSLAIDDTDIYVYYEDDQDDVVFDKYDGSSWSGETLLDQHGALQDVKVRWSYINNFDSAGAAPTGTNTYYFDASDAGPTDSGNAWTNDSNVFDNSVSTSATTTTANAQLSAEGTNAPASGGTISSVRARINGTWSGTGGCNTEANIYTNGAGQNLGTAQITGGSQAWGSYVTLSTPTGGWTWAKIQDLEVVIAAFDDGGCPLTSASVFKVEVMVHTTSSASQAEFDYVYSDGTDVFYNRLLPAGSTPGTQDSIATTTNGTAYSISAVSDAASPNDVHLLYLDNSGTAEVTYVRWDNNGASSDWQTPFTVDDTGSTSNRYVSLTLDTSTKDLWAAWVDQNSDDDVYYRQCDVSSLTSECDTGTPWGTKTSESTATGAVYNSLTTNYSSVGNVFGIWTNTSATPFAVSWSSINAAATNAAPSAPTTLYTNESETTAQSGVANPVGVGDSTPAFSAVYVDSDTGDIANKYEVIVYSDAGCTSQVWDSGSNGTAMTNCTQGNRCGDIEFAGTALPFDGTKYYWKIKYWDDEPAAGSFSDCTANFTMLSPAEQLKHGNYFFNQSTERKYTW